LVNENYSILSLLFLFSHIFSINCVCHLLARYFLWRFNTFTLSSLPFQFFRVFSSNDSKFQNPIYHIDLKIVSIASYTQKMYFFTSLCLLRSIRVSHTHIHSNFGSQTQLFVSPSSLLTIFFFFFPSTTRFYGSNPPIRVWIRNFHMGTFPILSLIFEEDHPTTSLTSK